MGASVGEPLSESLEDERSDCFALDDAVEAADNGTRGRELRNDGVGIVDSGSALITAFTVCPPAAGRSGLRTYRRDVVAD